MSDWQERITHDTAPAIRAEHDLRYRMAAPLILSGGSWADLGCGNGIAAADALGAERPAHAVLVDLEESAVEQAATLLGMPNARRVVADLTNPVSLAGIGERLLEGDGMPLVTCFEVVEHLANFLPLLQWGCSMVQEHDFTFLMSVPNDAFWSIQNPHHLTCWGEGSFEELRRLLPGEQTLLRQVALAGSALVDWEATAERYETPVEVGGPDTVATHFIIAFGPRHADVRRSAVAVQTDMLAQRRWERQRENDAAVSQADGERLAGIVEHQQEELRERTVWFEEWRRYIHDLERELHRPLSGVSEDELPEQDDIRSTT